MSEDLFHQQKNFPREKVEGRGVPWAGKLYAQCDRDGLLEEIQAHINSMDSDKASQYAKFLVQNASFPLHFFNSIPKVVLKLD